MQVHLTSIFALYAGNIGITACEVQLKHSMLVDLASLGVNLAPPRGLFKKSKGPLTTHLDPSSAQAAPPHSQHKQSKPKLAMQLTKMTVGVSNVVVGYQTAVTVATADRPEEEDGGSPLTLICTECITLQELTGEALPTAFRGSVQVNNLGVLHQETSDAPSSLTDPSGQRGSAPHHEVEVLHAGHFSLKVQTVSQGQRTASLGLHTQQGPDLATVHSLGGSARPDELAVVSSALPNLAATVSLSGWQSSFHADAVIAMCKAGADFASVARSTAAKLRSVKAESAHAPALSMQTPLTQPMEASGMAATASIQDAQGSVARQLSSLQRLPVVALTVQVSEWKTDVVIADHIVWGVTIPEAQCKLDSRTLVAVQQQHLHARLTQEHNQGQESGSSSQGPHDNSLGALGPGSPPVLLSGSSLQSLVAVAESPSLILRQIGVSLNQKPMLQCGEVEAALDLWPGQSRGAGAGLHSPRRQPSLGGLQTSCLLSLAVHLLC